MGLRRGALVAVEVVLVFLAGLAINAASDQLPGWMGEPRVVWPVLLLVLCLTLTTTLRGRPAEPGLPQVWSVPARNPNFTGRAAEQRWVFHRLKRHRKVAVYAMRGMGGVGKTQVAIEYCHRWANRYRAVWWIEAEDSTLVPGQVVLLGNAMGMVLPSSTEEAVGTVLSELRRRRDWLLVFDNAETVAAVRPYLPSGRGHVLVTTRRAGFEAIASVLDLDTFEREDSTALLRGRLPEISPERADELAALLEDLPLALEQAAAYLRQTAVPLPEYLSWLRASLDVVATRGRDVHRGPEHDKLATLWEPPLRRIAEEHLAAAQLLEICAYLGSDAIPLDLFTGNAVSGNAVSLPSPLDVAVKDPHGGFADAVGVLVDYSLLRRVNGDLLIHRMVRLAVRVRTATALSPSGALRPLDSAGNLLVADLRTRPPRLAGAWPRWRQLLSHVLVYGEFDADPTTRGWLLRRAGAYLLETGQLNDARLILERALRISEAAYGPRGPEVAVHLSDLAVVLTESGRPGEARQLLQRALTITENACGPHHPAVAVRMNNLGIALHESGLTAEAFPLIQRALAITEAEYGPEHPVVALRLNNLGVVIRGLFPNRTDEAVTLHRRALGIVEAVRPPGHPDVASAMNHLGAALLDLGRPLEARGLLGKALEIAEAVHGRDHPEVATVQTSLAMALRMLHSPADNRLLLEARELLERALASSGSVYGGDHPVIATRLDNLGLVLRELGQFDRVQALFRGRRHGRALYEQARSLHERALVITEAACGPGHPDVAKRLNSLAGAWRDLGRLDRAIPLLERALAITVGVFGPDHRDAAARLTELGRALSDVGRQDEGKRLITHAWAVRERLAREALEPLDGGS
ncbi:FxSxx-COOH system tetratricopeptide repeat protein [Saccharothrix sp. Mg75]|uniref:FxSxx-COOH system tetratricopeptide repeat protein n=1 Tax=Saccharothrix sp. Mg75 TaxID=3445357 RepID=UPI003EECDFEE